MERRVQVDGKWQCGRCKERKLPEDFGKDSARPNSLKSTCKECRKKYYKNNIDQIKERDREYRKNNKDKIKEQGREYRKNNKDKISLRKATASLRSQGCKATEKQLKEMFNYQKGRCKICGVYVSNNKPMRAIDHCHKTKKVRGWLCSKCNFGLGQFNDSPSLLRKAADYLESYS